MSLSPSLLPVNFIPQFPGAFERNHPSRRQDQLIPRPRRVATCVHDGRASCCTCQCSGAQEGRTPADAAVAVQSLPMSLLASTVSPGRYGDMLDAAADCNTGHAAMMQRGHRDVKRYPSGLPVDHRHPHRERGPLAHLTLHADRPTQQLRELLRDRQPQPRSLALGV